MLEPVVRKALVVLLVVVMVATGLPILMAMSAMAACPDCAPALVAGAGCVAAVLVAGTALLLAMAAGRYRSRDEMVRALLHPFLLERPPRLA